MLDSFAIAGLRALFIILSALLAGWLLKHRPRPLNTPSAWRQYRFGFVSFSLVFLPFAVAVFYLFVLAASLVWAGPSAFAALAVFIAFLLSAIAAAWAAGGFRWE